MEDYRAFPRKILMDNYIQKSRGHVHPPFGLQVPRDQIGRAWGCMISKFLWKISHRNLQRILPVVFQRPVYRAIHIEKLLFLYRPRTAGWTEDTYGKCPGNVRECRRCAIESPRRVWEGSGKACGHSFTNTNHDLYDALLCNLSYKSEHVY